MAVLWCGTGALPPQSHAFPNLSGRSVMGQPPGFSIPDMWGWRILCWVLGGHPMPHRVLSSISGLYLPLSWPSERKALHGIDGGPAECAQGQGSGDRASEQSCLMSPFARSVNWGKEAQSPCPTDFCFPRPWGLYHIHAAHWEYLKSHPGPPLCSGNLLSVHAHTRALVMGPAIKILADSHLRKSSSHTAASLGTLGGGSTGRASRTRCA